MCSNARAVHGRLLERFRQRLERICQCLERVGFGQRIERVCIRFQRFCFECGCACG